MDIKGLKFVESLYEDGESMVIMKERGNYYVGRAFVAEGDEWLASEIVGGRYAELRAVISYLKVKREKLIEKRSKIMQKINKYPSSLRLRKKANETQDKIQEYSKAISQLQKGIYADIKNRPIIAEKARKIKEDRAKND